MFDKFSWRHVPALLTATPMFFGGLYNGFAQPRQALLGYGMTEKIAISREAQIVYYGHSMRTSTLGLLLFAFYFKGDFAAVDMMMAFMAAYLGTADLILLWNFGNHSVLPVRLVSILLIGVWGFAGMTAGSHP